MGNGKAKPGDVHTGYGDNKGKAKHKAGKSGTLRRVWFSKGLNSGAGLIEEGEYGGAPFALVVEYVPPSHGRYGAKLVIIPANADVVALIDRHKLRGLTVYIDKDALAVEAHRQDLNKELSEAMNTDGVGYIWSHRLAWMTLRQLGAWVQERSVVRITFETLLNGIEINGSMEEVRRVIREVTMAIDKLAAGLETGSTFDSGDTRIFAPGTRKKKPDDKKGTPPSEWGE